MKFSNKLNLFLSLITFILIASILIEDIKSECVCSEYELVKELREDLEYNSKLDCLRETEPPKEGENDYQKQKRIAAQWDGDCSFESENEAFPWPKRLLENYPLIRGLIDVDGNPTNDKNQPDQADMCEIIRTLIGNNMIPGITMIDNGITTINKDLPYYIDCPGGGGESSICAATAGSFADPKGWVIFLDGQSMRLNDKPKYEAIKDDV